MESLKCEACGCDVSNNVIYDLMGTPLCPKCYYSMENEVREISIAVANGDPVADQKLNLRCEEEGISRLECIDVYGDPRNW